MAEQSQSTSADRRTVLRATALGVAVAGVGVTAAACSSSNTAAQGSAAQSAAAATTGGATAPAAGGSTVATSKVPVDGGFIDSSARVVVTQPSAGEYKAFTAVCTHAQCTVSTVSNNVIQCPCHGSQYSAKDGSVIQGPAPAPLAAVTFKVSGSTITYNT